MTATATATATPRRTESDRLLVDAAAGYQPQHVVNLDLRGMVKSNFVGLRKEINERRGLALEADEKNHVLLDHIKEAIDDKRSEVEALEHKVRAAEEEFEKTKEVNMLTYQFIPSFQTCDGRREMLMICE